MRVTADDPLIDSNIGDKMINDLVSNKADYCSNSIKRTYPLGMDLECFNFDTLKYVWENATEGYQKQHVTAYILDNVDKFKIISEINEKDFSNYRWTVDTYEDYKFVNEIYSKIKNPFKFSWHEVIDLIYNNDYLMDINKHIEQKKHGEI